MRRSVSGTEIVSLSACNTGKGVIDYSDGIYGLVRAFRIAGAKNVLVTLKNVNDESSKDFMISFYENYLSSYGQLTPSEALHKTRISFIHHKRKSYRNPSIWAPYIVIGK